MSTFQVKLGKPAFSGSQTVSLVKLKKKKIPGPEVSKLPGPPKNALNSQTPNLYPPPSLGNHICFLCL